MDFYNGYVHYYYHKDNSEYVRCVSSGQAWEFDNSVISDAKTEPAKAPEITQPAPPPVSPKGDYYALLIGNNKYEYFPTLKTAIQDATAMADILKNKYGFQTRLLKNAERREMVSALNNYRRILTQDDNLLIYYAGHGKFDEKAGKAYWLPTNAEPSDDTEWIIADTITSNIRRISSAHVLIVSDSCYSGTLARTRTGITDLRTGESRYYYLNKMIGKKSRTLIASGGNEPVSDEGRKGHSIFAQAFLDGLKEMEPSVFLAEELFYQHIKEPVAGNAAQVPEYQIIQNSGHDGGDFVFVRQK